MDRLRIQLNVIDPPRTVVLKRFRRVPNVDGLSDKIANEIKIWKILSALNMPNITPFLGTIDGSQTNLQSESRYIYPWPISEYYPGGDLHEFLRDRGQNTGPPARTKILEGVIRGLSSIHGQLIVHGDLKPANILVVEEPGGIVAKICDFGSSRIRHFCINGPEDGGGTPRWESPELLVDNPQKTRQSDIWAFACVALQVQFGRFPYPCNEIQAQMMLMAGLPPATADSVDLTLPLSKAVWIQMQSCWLTEPAARPEAEALMIEFETIIALQGP
ncbi:hypothetical protein FRC08_009593 [Ceratobasidium sp. 394]|nr:hypothetical protein FRC08_009593 [Ceratobasidium sp. 394]